MLLAQRRKQAIKAVKKRIGRLEREMGDREPRSWYSFQAAMRVLQRSGALTSDPTPVLTPLGEAVSSVRAVNELWQGLVLLSQELDTLEPAALAGVVAALLAPECINRPTAFSSFPAGSESMEALQRLAPIADKVLEIQDEEGFEAPLLVNAGFSGLVEMWAEGGTWRVPSASRRLTHRRFRVELPRLLASSACKAGCLRWARATVNRVVTSWCCLLSVAGRRSAKQRTWTRATWRGCCGGSQTT